MDLCAYNNIINVCLDTLDVCIHVNTTFNIIMHAAAYNF